MKYISIFIVFLVIFAVLSEKSHRRNSYILGEPRSGDSIVRSLRKLETCVRYDISTVKWRMAFLAAVISTICIYILLHRKIPTDKECLLTIIPIFISYATMWKIFVSTTGMEVVNYAQGNVDNIRHRLSKEKSFILPTNWEIYSHI